MVCPLARPDPNTEPSVRFVWFVDF